MAAMAACTRPLSRWRARLGPRPLDWVFPPGSPWPVSTWATTSAAAPRTAFKQWWLWQRGLNEGAGADSGGTYHALEHSSLA